MSNVKSRRATPRRRSAPRWTRTDWDAANPILLTRCQYRCERCGRPLDNNVERHHRQRREVGGDRLAVVVALHSDCHRWVTEHPEESRRNGWIVSVGQRDPSVIPMLQWGTRWVLLNDNGDAIPCPAPPPDATGQPDAHG